ncbi:porphobilinogen deaminase [Phycomyces nitens]|nr:porphobilinogen deaminase [Phycomyces nitens]
MASPQGKNYAIGTRKSELAMVQTHLVRDILQKKFPQHTFSVQSMSTSGDRILDLALNKIGEKALFTKELEVALEDGRVDLVVHSLKDLPTVLPEGMYLGAVLERENPHDALVLAPGLDGHTLATLPKGSVVGTSSLRRVAQLKRRYPHLVFDDMRGNLNTRLAKLDAVDSRFSGIILAVAGLVRINRDDRISQIIEPSDSLHAVSQGALGIECRENDKDIRALLESLNHTETRIMCLSERSLMRTLEGGCSVPIGVNTKLDKNSLRLRGLVASLDGQEVVEYEDSISLENANDAKKFELAETLGNRVAAKLVELGANKILDVLRH